MLNGGRCNDEVGIGVETVPSFSSFTLSEIPHPKSEIDNSISAIHSPISDIHSHPLKPYQLPPLPVVLSAGCTQI